MAIGNHCTTISNINIDNINNNTNNTNIDKKNGTCQMGTIWRPQVSARSANNRRRQQFYVVIVPACILRRQLKLRARNRCILRVMMLQQWIRLASNETLKPVAAWKIRRGHSLDPHRQPPSGAGAMAFKQMKKVTSQKPCSLTVTSKRG
jgi:hypothetical protein